MEYPNLFPLASKLDFFMKGFFAELTWLHAVDFEILRAGAQLHVSPQETWQIPEGDRLHLIPDSQLKEFFIGQILTEQIFDSPQMSKEGAEQIWQGLQGQFDEKWTIAYTNNYHPWGTAEMPAYFVPISSREPSSQCIFFCGRENVLAFRYVYSEQRAQDHHFDVERYGYQEPPAAELQAHWSNRICPAQQPVSLFDWMEDANAWFRERNSRYRTHRSQIYEEVAKPLYGQKKILFEEREQELIVVPVDALV